MGNKRIGSSFDDFLKSQGIYEQVMATARNRVEEYQRSFQHKSNTKDNDNAGSIRNSNRREVE